MVEVNLGSPEPAVETPPVEPEVKPITPEPKPMITTKVNTQADLSHTKVEKKKIEKRKKICLKNGEKNTEREFNHK